MEAKTPTDGLINHVEQALRYGYSNNKNGPPFVMLTNFTETWCFDVTLKINPKNPRSGRKVELKWDQYLEDHNFDELWQLSKESALNGELDKLLLKKSGLEKLPVDKSILNNLKQWRESLAKDIYKNNPKLFNSGDKESNSKLLKEITQKLLDRIVFIRFCEDRKLTYRKSLNGIFGERTDTVGTKTMLFLEQEFKHYDTNFDSDLFSHKEWEKDLAIDWLVMEKIIDDAYNNPYQFDAIPLDVLGNIYEQYLGDTIRLTDSQVKYEMKPDVRKAGGVYYTPEYIVDYIVKNTIGKLLTELPHNKVKELKILDPACGSGSFLIKAYDEMIVYYQSQQKKPLSVAEKKDILLKHIYGVDLDEQAVEVTKLSLMLKMLEGEHGLVSAHAILPMLDANIKCGNSLVSGDMLELKKYFGNDWHKVKPFNWDKDISFARIMKRGGFDVVIGNPPYIFARDEGFTQAEKDYFYQTYKSVQYQLNTYIMFTEKAFNLLNSNGHFGFIIPNNWLTIDTTSDFRKFLITNARQIQIVNSYDKVFEHANVDTTILLFGKTGDSKITFYEMRNKTIELVSKQSSSNFTAGNNYIINYELLKADDKIDLYRKIEQGSVPLENIATARVGIKAYQTGKGKPKQTEHEKKNRVFHKTEKTNDNYYKYLDGCDVQRYFLGWSKEYINYGKHLAEPRALDLFKGERLLIRQIPAQPPYSILSSYIDKVYINDLNSMIVKKLENQYSIKFLLGVINSRLISFWFFYKFGKLQRKLFPQFKIKELSIFPIREINFKETAEKKLHDKIVSLVDIMIDLNKNIQTAKGNEKEQVQKQIDQTDNEIDTLVYKLYGLTDKEIKIIEESAK